MHKIDECIVGLNYLGLIHGIIGLDAKKIGIINDENHSMQGPWCENLGKLEYYFITKLGKEFKITTLEDFHKYITPQKTVIFLDEKQIELGPSALTNMRELARKVPDLFGNELIESLFKFDKVEFDKNAEELFVDFSEYLYQNKGLTSHGISELIWTSEMSKIFAQFCSKMKNFDNLMAKQLHFVLQVLFQNIFSNEYSEDETSYLFLSILSPRFKLNRVDFEKALLFEFRSKGGNIFSGQMVEWEVYKNSVNFVLMQSHEGLLRSQNFFLYGSLSHDLPFAQKFETKTYSSIRMKCQISHDLVSNYTDKRLLFSSSGQMGTQFPHWEMTFDHEGVMHAHFVYFDSAGCRPSFYYQNAREKILQSLEFIFPNLDRVGHSYRIELGPFEAQWEETPYKLPKKNDGVLYNKGTRNSALAGVSYWGPMRCKSFGLLSFLQQQKNLILSP